LSNRIGVSLWKGMMKYRPLRREELVAVIDGKSAARRVPVMLHFWISPELFGQNRKAVDDLLGRYPMDAEIIELQTPALYADEAPPEDPSYSWTPWSKPPDCEKALDVSGPLGGWDRFDEMMMSFPSPDSHCLFPADIPAGDGRYRLGVWWFCLFERHWSIRGMAQALMDYYTNPAGVHRLYRALTDFYKRLIARAAETLDLDGILTSDDLGTQTGPFFSPGIFDEFFAPYYRELIASAHELGLHFWLHCCGNVEPLIGRFVDLGIDVIHPIQKYTMDERLIAEKYGHDICIWAGFDVQRIIPRGTPRDVRTEARFMIDTYYRPEGRLMLAAGNAIRDDCPVASLEALFDEWFSYGADSIGSTTRP